MAIHLNSSTGELYLYGVVGFDSADDGSFNDSDVAESLDRLRGKRVKVYINSPGGGFSQGVAIYNLLKRHRAGVETIVDGLAGSIASIIFLAGSRRVMMANSKLMIHRAIAATSGNVGDFSKMADLLDQHDQVLLDIYAGYMVGKTRSEIAAMLEAETWLTPSEAYAMGLATDLTPATSKQTPKVAAWFQRPPSDLLEANGVVTPCLWDQRREFMRLRYR
jgi:ATP-dependent Clp protease protease subunit